MGFVWVMLGGAVGSGLRHALQGVTEARFGVAWPWGTWIANVVGSFALGLLFAWSEGRPVEQTETLRLAVGVGLLGGFTTYSAFNLQVLRMASAGESFRAAQYVAVTVVVCLIGGALGFVLARAFR